MALLKELPTPFGENIKAEYWKVKIPQLDWDEKNATIVLFGFVNVEDRMNSYQPISTICIPINGERFDMIFSEEILSQEGMTTRKSVYEYIKTNDSRFADAIDLI